MKTNLEQLETVRTYIDHHFTEPLSLDALAQRAYLSRYHLIRQFRRHFHITPHQYLIQKRIDHAKYLLAESTLPVTEICYAVGFESIGTFSARFHHIVGWSPSAYRARVWEQRQNPFKFIPGCFRTMYGLSMSSD